MTRSKLVTCGLQVFVVLLSVVLGGCIRQEDESGDYVEITEYEGEDLSSIADFRENSIKGPQQIDRESSVLHITGLVEHPQNYTYDEVLIEFTTQKKVVRLDCVDGWSVTILWEGVLVSDLLK